MCIQRERKFVSSAFHFEKGRCNLMTAICIQKFHLSYKWKMKCWIQRLHAHLPKYMHVLWRKMYSWLFWPIKLFRYPNHRITWFVLLLDWFPYRGNAWNWDFVKRIGRNHLLNGKICLQNCRMKSPWPDDHLDHFKRDFGLDYVFSS